MLSFRETWDRLKREASADTGWQSLRIFPDARCTLRAAVRIPDKMPALLLELDAVSIEKVVEYPAASGFELHPEPIQPGPHGRVRLCLVLVDPVYEDEFGALAEDVATAVQHGSDDSDALRRMLARLYAWQRFFRTHAEGLAIEAQTGLFAELSFLSQVLLPHLTPYDALSGWKGPNRGLRDFVFPSCEIEVKGSVSHSKIHVLNEDQLDEADASVLLLAHVLLKTSSVGKNLPELVASVHDGIKSTDEASGERFEQLLLDYGYMENHSGRYAARRFALPTISFFQVQKDFPRLRRSDLSPAIASVSYALDVEMCMPYLIEADKAQSLISAGR